MSPKRRRRRPRNIWGTPPEPSRPFDYEDDFEPEGEDAPEAIAEPEPEAVAEPEEIEVPEPEEIDVRQPDEPVPTGPKHLQKRAVVLPRFGKRGRHAARAGGETPAEIEPIEAEQIEAEQIEAERVEEPVVARDDREELIFDEDPLPEDELFPGTSRRRAKHRKRSVVVPRKSKPGRHALGQDQPESEPEPVAEAYAEVVEEESVPEFDIMEEPPAAEIETDYRPRHQRRRRVLFPGRNRPGKHSVGAPAPHAPESPEVPELEEPPPEPVAPEPEYEGLEEVEPPDEPEFQEEIEPYEPRKDKRRRRRGRHREPGSPVLPRQRGKKGRHSIGTAGESEEELVFEDLDEDFDVVELEQEAAAEVVVEEPVAEPEPVFEDEVVFDDEDVIVVEEPEELAPFEPRRKRRKRSTRVRYVAGLLTAVIFAAATVAVALTLDRGADPSADDGPSASGAAALPEEVATTTLVYAVKEADEDEGLVWLTLLAYDPVDEQASAIYIPAHLASEIPGRGLLSLSEGWVSGGPSLLLSSAENLLGLRIDRFVEISDNDAQILFDATGPLTVNVPSEVSVPHGASEARLIFDEGPQELSAEFLVRLLYTRGLDVDDAELGSRILSFWDALLENYSSDRAALGNVIRETGPALESDADTNEIVEFFESLASAPDESVILTSLPVRPIAAGDSELYSADLEETQELLEDTIGTVPSTGDDVRVQILNGNGVPGIGAEVAERLIGEGFRVILSGNARRFDYETTLIVTYDESPEGKALAERARELLGVGEVQVSAQEQGSVDLTIVVGKDFLGAR